MRNFFLVINKEKIYAYIVSIFTICTLFFVSGVVHKEIDKTEVTYSDINNSIVENSSVNNIDGYKAN